MKILTFFLFALFSFFSQKILFSQTVDFYQDNIILWDRISSQPDTTLNSFFGRVKLMFTSSDTIKYFNLSVSGGGITNNWPVKNYPVKSLDSLGNSESRYFSFLINDSNSSGINVDSIDYGFSLTSDTVLLTPTINSRALVSDFDFIIFNGMIDNHPINKSPLLNPENNIDISGNTVPGYPIQDCGVDECIPAFLSDAAKYLKKIYPNLFSGTDSLITITKMKSFTQWTQDGVYLYSNGNFFSIYVNDSLFSNSIPMLMSNIIDSITSNDLDNTIIPSLNQFEAVSFFVNYKWTSPGSGITSNTKHAVSIREITKIRSGAFGDVYTLTFSHDATQGAPGGTIIESALYYPSINRITFPEISNSPSSLENLMAISPGMQQSDLGCVVIEKNKTVPVEIAAFTSQVDKRDVKLSWTTTHEENNIGFEVQNSIDGFNWIIKGFVHSYGNSNSTRTYYYEDKNLNSGNYRYRLKQIDFNGNFQYYYLMNEVTIGIPNKFALYQNYPNPFNPSTKINYDIPKDGIVILRIFDINGREIKTLINEFKLAGYYSVDFVSINLSSGIYFYLLKSAGLSLSKKMAIVK